MLFRKNILDKRVDLWSWIIAPKKLLYARLDSVKDPQKGRCPLPSGSVHILETYAQGWMTHSPNTLAGPASEFLDNGS